MKAKPSPHQSHRNSCSVPAPVFLVGIHSAGQDLLIPLRKGGLFPEAIQVWGELIAQINFPAVICLAQGNPKISGAIVWDNRNHGTKAPRILATGWMAWAIAAADDYIGTVPLPIDTIVRSLCNFQKGAQCRTRLDQPTKGNGHRKNPYRRGKCTR